MLQGVLGLNEQFADFDDPPDGILPALCDRFSPVGAGKADCGRGSAYSLPSQRYWGFSTLSILFATTNTISPVHLFIR